MSYMVEFTPVNERYGKEADPVEVETFNDALMAVIDFTTQFGHSYRVYPTKSKEAGIIKWNDITVNHYFIWEM